MTKADLMKLIRYGCDHYFDIMLDDVMPNDVALGIIMGHMDVWHDTASLLVPFGHEMYDFISDVYQELCCMLIENKYRYRG